MNKINIPDFVKDSLSSLTDEEIINKYNLKERKDISLILQSKEGQREIRKQQKPLTEEEENNLKNLSNGLNNCLELLK